MMDHFISLQPHLILLNFLKHCFITTGGPVTSTGRPKPALPQASHPQDHSAIVAVETEKLRKEYEAKLAVMKSSYEAELMSKQKLQEEMERLQNEYNKKVHNVEEQYADTAGVGTGAVTAESAISMIALANDLVSRCSYSKTRRMDPDIFNRRVSNGNLYLMLWNPKNYNSASGNLKLLIMFSGKLHCFLSLYSIVV